MNGNDQSSQGVHRRCFLAGGVIGTLIGAFAGGALTATSSAAEPEPDPPSTGRSSNSSQHRPAEIEVYRAKHPDNDEGEWQVRVYIDSLRDDDRVAIEPHPDPMFLNPVSIGHQGMYTEAKEGEDVRVYSIDFDGSTTMHFSGDVTELEDVTCEVHNLGGCDDDDE